jgi:hypothetical protein
MSVPPRVTRDEVDRMERLAGKGSRIYEITEAQCDAWEAFLAGNQAEDKRLRDEHEQRLAALEQERAAAREIDRVAAEAEMEADIRAAFFARSPSATDAEFEALYPRLREERLLLNARRDILAEEAAALAQTVPAGYRGTW